MMKKHSASADERLRLAGDPDPEAPLVGALLRYAHNQVVDRLLRELKEAGYDDLHEAHFYVLRFPPPDGVRPGELAQRAQMTKQAMNYLLVQLEELGYVARQPAPASKGRLVSLTPRGWEVALLQRRVIRALEREWAEKVGKKRFETFIEVLTTLAQGEEDGGESL